MCENCDKAREEYKKKEAPLWEEYVRKRAPIVKECKKKLSQCKDLKKAEKEENELVKPILQGMLQYFEEKGG